MQRSKTALPLRSLHRHHIDSTTRATVCARRQMARGCPTTRLVDLTCAAPHGSAPAAYHTPTPTHPSNHTPTLTPKFTLTPAPQLRPQPTRHTPHHATPCHTTRSRWTSATTPTATPRSRAQRSALRCAPGSNSQRAAATASRQLERTASCMPWMAMISACGPHTTRQAPSRTWRASRPIAATTATGRSPY